MSIQRGETMRTAIDDLHERITVRYADKARDAMGNIIKTDWHDRFTVWAKVLPLSSNRSEGYQEYQNTAVYRITVRYRTDIQPDDEILWRGKTLHITKPPYDAEARQMWTVFECEELMPDAGEL